MRLIHLADLHLGKRVNEFSMIDGQKYVLRQVLDVAANKHIDGVMIAGDVYDKAVPSAEGVLLLDWFLTELSALDMPVYMISGNHDSGERLTFGAQILKKNKVYISSVYNGVLEPIKLEDEFGTVNLYLLPFIKPIHVRKALNIDHEIAMNYQQAMEEVIGRTDLNKSERNVLVAHQLVTGASTCDSEDLSIGGIDNIDAAVFKDFDYVALGHIHGPQKMTRETVRYAGTLLKYSFSECKHKKSITIVDIKDKGDISIEEILVRPEHDMREIKGTYDELMDYDNYKDTNKEDYLRVILTDEEEIPEVLGKLRSVYPNIMKLEYDNIRTRSITKVQEDISVEKRSPIEYVENFYEKQNGQAMTEKQRKLVLSSIERIWGGGSDETN